MARPAGPGATTLSEALLSMKSDSLGAMVRQLPIPTPRPTRKADMAAVIKRHLSGASLRKLWDGLDAMQQRAVGEALYGPRGEFEPDRFQAKYGSLPAGLGPMGYREVSPLGFFLYSETRYPGTATVVPGDLAERLRAFVPPPPEATLAAVDELPEAVEQRERGYVAAGKTPKYRRVALVRRDMERAAPRDLLAVLRLIDRGEVAASAKTRQASAAAMRRIGEVLDGGDFFDPAEKKKRRWDQVAGPVRAFAWPWLVQAARLAEVRGSRLALTKTGRAALGAPPAETLRRLWQRWLKNTLLDEFSRIDDVKGQTRGKGRRAMTAATNRRETIAAALARCPENRWVCFDAFSRFMRAASFRFGITRDPWSLYLADPHYGSLGYAGAHDWDLLEGRYLLCLLFEYAATLGLVDVAYTEPHGARLDFTDNWGTDELAYLSRYDGLEYFRLNSLGAWCLGVASTYEPGAPPARASLTVFPDLRLRAEGPLPPDESLLLETYASTEAEGVWRLDRDKALSAIENGHDIGELRAFLAARDDQSLPELVEGFLRNVARGAGALAPKGTALLVECADAEVADRIANDKETASLCMAAGERRLAVPMKSEDAFRKAVRKLGYGLPRARPPARRA